LPEGASATLENFDSIISQLPVDQFRDWLLRMSQNQIFQIGEAFKTEQETCNQILGGVASLKPSFTENGDHENGRLRPRSARYHHKDSEGQYESAPEDEDEE
jgi:hypothetical protein